jgi:hypothetical protein
MHTALTLILRKVPLYFKRSSKASLINEKVFFSR